MADRFLLVWSSLFFTLALTTARYHRHRPNGHHYLSTGTRSVCYPRVGCFDSAYPFNNTGEVPLDPQFIDTRFFLYTRQHPETPETIRVDDRSSLLNSAFNADHPVKVITHGFLATGSMEWVKNISREFLRKEPMNVLSVDWGRGAGFPYVQAAANTRLVGAELANLIVFLNHETGSRPDQFHLIGHSLGAHISGYTGHRIQGIGRITGLDPAQPNFQGKSPLVRLDPSDADFVDVIHTNGSPYDTLGGFGMLQAVGHVDFYPNGGMQQPGCPHDGWSTFMSSAYSSGMEEAEFSVGCNHNRAPEYFMETINTHCPFRAFPCDNYDDFLAGDCTDCDGQCPSMGQLSSHRGSVYLLTNSQSPFCGYHYAVTIQLGVHMQPTQGVVKIRLHGSTSQTRIVRIHRGAIEPGSMLKLVFVAHSDIGTFEDVHVTFERIYGYLDYLDFWNSNSVIQVKRVIVHSMGDQQRKVFCPSVDTVRNGGGVWLSNGVDEGRSHC